MKILKIAQFENEGQDFEEKFTDEKMPFEAEFDLKNKQFGPSHAASILNDISKSFTERLDSNYTIDGAEGLFEYKDGKVYKITVEPAKSRPAKTTPYYQNDDIQT